MSIAQSAIESTVSAVEATADTAIVLTSTAAEGVTEVAKQSGSFMAAALSKVASTNLGTAGKYALGAAIIGGGAYGVYKLQKVVRSKLAARAA
jgi:hypothetical protein